MTVCANPNQRASMSIPMIAATLVAISSTFTTMSALAQGAAQTFPSKTITIIVPASPGGAIDLVARLTGNKMGQHWGKPVIVENRAGANAVFGVNTARAAPRT